MRNGNTLRVRAGGHSGVRVRVMTRASVAVIVRFYFAVVLVPYFSAILCIRIAQMWNGNCVRITVTVRGLGLRSGLRLALGSSLYF